MADLERRTSRWLMLSDDLRELCIESDDALDAFVASLVACAAATDATIKPLVEHRMAARQEGWIPLPAPESLESPAPAAV